MTIRELIKQLIEFNPDAEVKVRYDNNPSTDFTLAWGEISENGMDKKRQPIVTIFVDEEKESNLSSQN